MSLSAGDQDAPDRYEQLSPSACAANPGELLQCSGVGGAAEYRQVRAHTERLPIEPQESCERVGDGCGSTEPVQSEETHC